MKANEILKEAIKAKEIDVTKTTSFSNKEYKSKASEVNESIRKINTAYTLSAQNAWKYSVQ